MATILTRAGKASALAASEYDDALKRETNTEAGAYTVVAADNRSTVEYTGSGGHTITLPDCSTIKSSEDTGDFQVTIKHGGTGALTVDFAASDTVDGTDEALTLAASEVITLKAGTGDDWMITSRCIPDGTAGYVMRMGVINPAWQPPVIGALVHRDSSANVDNGWDYNVNLVGTVIYETVECVSNVTATEGATTIITVPSGYSWMQVSGIVQFAANATGARGAQVLQTNATGDTDVALVPPQMVLFGGVGLSGTPTRIPFATGWIQVNAGEYYKLGTYQNSGGVLSIEGTHMRVKFG